MRRILLDVCEHKLAPNLPYAKSLFFGRFEPLKNAISGVARFVQVALHIGEAIEHEECLALRHEGDYMILNNQFISYNKRQDFQSIHYVGDKLDGKLENEKRKRQKGCLSRKFDGRNGF
nr:DNA-directed RNA polymerase 2, chloroplastic/mitochondrial [Tanacetum cinerariifolium]